MLDHDLIRLLNLIVLVMIVWQNSKAMCIGFWTLLVGLEIKTFAIKIGALNRMLSVFR